MSLPTSPARVRVPRAAWEAVERARLTVVPRTASRAPRAPFAVLVIAVLALGTVGLLMFNTHMQQVSFRATALQERADALTAREQALSMQLAHLRDPQVLASRAKRLGMVVPPEPAFIRLSDGKVVGDPVVATPADGVRINPYPAPKPARLAPRPLIVHVPAPAQAPKTQAPPAVTSTATTNGDVTGPASTTSGATTGRKGSTHRTAGHGATH
jgi:cell division protein FtsB